MLPSLLGQHRTREGEDGGAQWDHEVCSTVLLPTGCLSLPAERKHAQVEISGKVKLELFHAEPWDAGGIWAKIFPSTQSLPFS